jgi:hypothetical protein
MYRFLIESNHTAEDCHDIVNQFIFHGHINNFEWGCKAGIHTSWAIIEAENVSDALLTVPPALRHKTRAIQLNKFTPEMVEDFHEKS